MLSIFTKCPSTIVLQQRIKRICNDTEILHIDTLIVTHINETPQDVQINSIKHLQDEPPYWLEAAENCRRAVYCAPALRKKHSTTSMHKTHRGGQSTNQLDALQRPSAKPTGDRKQGGPCLTLVHNLRSTTCTRS